MFMFELRTYPGYVDPKEFTSSWTKIASLFRERSRILEVRLRRRGMSQDGVWTSP
jgi:hypothetical protein